MSKPGGLSASTKKDITNDWARAFPSLRIHKPMWLLKRHGPILVGVILDRTRSNDVYLPKFHVHNLLAPSPAILLSLVYPVPDVRQPKLSREIKVSRHMEDYLSAVVFLRQTIDALESPLLNWPQVVKLHCDFIRQKRNYAVAKYCEGVFRDVILLAHWCGHGDYARHCQKEAVRIMQNWIPPVDVAGWQIALEGLINRDAMAKTLETELAKHKLQHIPVFELDFEGAAECITQVYVEAWC